MKAHLYAVCLSGEWTWRVSLSWSVDCKYWLDRRRHEAIILVEPAMPAGVAFWLKERLAQDLRISASSRDFLHRMELALQQMLPFHFSLTPSSLRLRLIRANEAQPSSSLLRKDLNPLRMDVYHRLVSLLSGRLLLPDEFRALLAHDRLEIPPDQLPDYLQLAYLMGDIDLLGGMASEYPWGWFRKWFRWGAKTGEKRVRFRCRRCGSGPEALEPSQCARCGSGCVYCRECLTLGLVKRCSLLIKGKPDKLSAVKEQVHLLPRFLAERLDGWNLSPPQRAAAEAGLDFLAKPVQPQRGFPGRMFFIWAVTGAGKTEMVFPIDGLKLDIKRIC